MDYTQEKHLRVGRLNVAYDNDSYGKPIESHLLPLWLPSNRDGWLAILDTRLGDYFSCSFSSPFPFSSLFKAMSSQY